MGSVISENVCIRDKGKAKDNELGIYLFYKSRKNQNKNKNT